MNKIFKIIWSEAIHAYVAVSELTKNHSRSKSRAKLAAGAIGLGLLAGSVGVLPAYAAVTTTESPYAVETGTVVTATDDHDNPSAKPTTTKADIAIGKDSYAKGQHSTAIGNDSKVDADQSIAIGQNSKVGNEEGQSVSASIAIGNSSVASGSDATVIGAQASGIYGSVVIGKDSKTTGAGIRGVAIGLQSEVQTASGIAIGDNAKNIAKNDDLIGSKPGIAIGCLTESYGESIAMGTQTKAHGAYSVAIGPFSEIKEGANYSVANGYLSTVNSAYSTALGAWTNVNSTDGTAVGSEAIIGTNSDGSTAVASFAKIGTNSANSTALGYYATIGDKSEQSIAAGYKAKVYSANSTALGSWASVGSNSGFSTVTGYNAAIGDNSVQSTATGYYAKINSSYSTAIGSQSAIGANSAQSIAAGYKATINSGNGTALGAWATIGSNSGFSTATGYYAVIGDNVAHGTALGAYTKVAANNGVALGYFSSASTAYGIYGYDPLTKTASTNSSSTWKSTLGAVSVGNADKGYTRQITNVAAGTNDTDAVNVAQLKQLENAISAGANDTHIEAGEHKVTDNKVSINIVDASGNTTGTVTITDVASKTELDNVSQRVTTIEGDIKNIKTDITNIQQTAGKHSSVSTEDSNLIIDSTGTNEAGGKDYKLSLNKDQVLDSVTTDDTVMNNAGLKVGDTVTVTKEGLKVGDNVSVTQNAVTAGNTSISDKGLTIGGNTYVSSDGLNANSQKIINVADGEISATSKDAVNGSQLHATNQQVINNSNRINRLGDRINKVGAGAAALAALHPMDFDPDDKWSFAAGYGNYANENAVALGAFYRPNEKVMFSVGGTMGNGENMVNAGISFSLDRTSHVSNSRTAMAREILELRAEVAELKAMISRGGLGSIDEDKMKLFPDVPENHWAYEYIAKLAGNGIIEGYPDGTFAGDRLMSRYEFAAMLYRAMQNGAQLDSKIINEFAPEMGRIRVDRISGKDNDRNKIERVRVNYGDQNDKRDHYGSRISPANE